MTSLGAIANFRVIRPLRPLGSAVGTLREVCLTVAAGRSNQGSDGPEMVGLRQSPRLLLQRVETHHSWHLTPRLDIRVSTSLLRSLHMPGATPATPRPEGAPTSPPPVAASLVERRIETVLARHTQSIAETLVASRVRVAPTGTASGTLAVAPSAPRGATVVLTAPPVPSPPQMILARPSRIAGIEPEARPGPAPVAEPERPARAPQPAPRVADLQVERIADQVVRALDHRMVAWRERMGRR